MFYHSNVTRRTFHASKGLESHTTLLISVCLYDSCKPFKNDVSRQYKQEKDPRSNHYDLAQTEEAFRFAYVAATRASHHCYWVIPKKQMDNQFGAAIRANSQLINLIELSKGDEFSLIEAE